MGTISSGGLISGLDTANLIKQLMAIESRPLDLVKTQIKNAQSAQTAYLDLSARFTSSLAGLNRLASAEMFRTRSATSSNTDVLSATAGSNTALGSYAFRILSLATTHQVIAAGIATRDKTPVGAGTLTFESAGGRLDTSTSLASLNGGSGVRQGVIRITDREGNKTDVDLTGASSIDDVVETINAQADVNVRARIDGEKIVLTDTSESGTGKLRVQDVGSGHMAADLGIAGTSTTTEIAGKDLVRLSESTLLSTLNDGLGVRTSNSTGDVRIKLNDGIDLDVNLSSNLQFTTKLQALNHGQGIQAGTIRLTNRNGQTADVNIAASGTIQDVVNAINATGISISASLSGSKINITDTSGGTALNLKIEDITGSAAAGLGITADVDASGVIGGEIYRVDTLGDVFRAIQYATGNDGRVTVGMSSNGNGISLTDNKGLGGFTVEALNGSKAAEDLGLSGIAPAESIETRDLVSGLNTVMLRTLNGGKGVGTGTARFTLGNGSQVTIDFTGSHTLDDLIKRINNAVDGSGAPAGLVATIDSGGTGVSIQDNSGGTGNLAVADVSGTTASDLHLTAASASRLSSGDLQKKYISETTLLSSLNGGAGIKYGTVRLTGANGGSEDITITSTGQRTIGDVIKALNNNNINLTARVNANGDGIEFVDNSGSTGQVIVAERDSGGTAASLGILGKSQIGSSVFTGSFAKKVEITGNETLDQAVKKINDAGVGVSASVLNDGSATAPYRLVLTASTSGKNGRMAYTTTIPGMSLDTMVEAQDAVVAIGTSSVSGSTLVTSSTNTVTGLVDGLTLNLTSTSPSAVTVTVGQDADAIVTSMNSFIKGVNDAMSRIGDLTSYDPDTEQKGILLGDYTVQQIQDQVFSLLTKTISGKGLTYSNLTQIGLNIGDGATLGLDETKFRAALQSDPQAVEKLFTLTSKDADGKTVNQGIGLKLKDLVEQITDSDTGTIAKQSKAIQDRVDLYNARATHLQDLLDQKEARLTLQFNNMELVLSKLQSQQSALASLSTLSTSTSSSS